MARDIADFSGTVVAPGGSYPYGRIKNAPAGTRVNEQMLGDVIQFHQKAMAEAGVTPNGLPDNSSDGFQLYEAFATLAGRDAWGAIPTSGAGSTTYTVTSGGGSISVPPSSRIYERIRVVGKTLYYSSKIESASITGLVDGINVNVTTLGGLFSFSNVNARVLGLFDEVNPVLIITLRTAPIHFSMQITNGTGFISVPTGSRSFDINIVAEFD